uniref:Uncharacterized protein n=1 Tax=Buteo japonicus TaxID=224669 RepID=A0A8C0C2G4_9AVES
LRRFRLRLFLSFEQRLRPGSLPLFEGRWCSEQASSYLSKSRLGRHHTQRHWFGSSGSLLGFSLFHEGKIHIHFQSWHTLALQEDWIDVCVFARMP